MSTMVGCGGRNGLLQKNQVHRDPSIKREGAQTDKGDLKDNVEERCIGYIGK